MWIYFWEQVWSDENTSVKWNWLTAELQERFWEQWNYQNRGHGYPRHEYMIEGEDYYDY